MPKTQHTTTAAMEMLATYKRHLDEDIAQYCRDLLHTTGAQFGVYSRSALEAYVSLLQRGGKRLRGALVMSSYAMLGGKNKAMILQAARAIEMLHAYILLIDDIQDRSEVRRGGDTAHITLKEHHQTHGLHGDATHFGLSVAMGAALVGGHLAQQEITKLHVNDATKVRVLDLLNETMAITGHGQINDIFNEAVQTVDESQVQRALTWKTAYYSFLNPLQVGALLAGASSKDLAHLHEYSTHMGLTFQITDDILGTFGNEFESGKSAEDDIKEGKITILISRALTKANPQQRQILTRSLGDRGLTHAEHIACKQVIEGTGALDYARQLAAEHARLALVSLEAVPQTWEAHGVAFLRALTGFVVNRTA